MKWAEQGIDPGLFLCGAIESDSSPSVYRRLLEDIALADTVVAPAPNPILVIRGEITTGSASYEGRR
jgi:hypothetical protein